MMGMMFDYLYFDHIVAVYLPHVVLFDKNIKMTRKPGRNRGKIRLGEPRKVKDERKYKRRE